MTHETPTPETDLEEANQTQRFGGYMVKADFARRLERERDAARAKIEAMREAISEAYAALDACSHNLHSAYGKLSDNADAALAKLQPFIKP